MFRDNPLVTGAETARFRLPAPLTPLLFLMLFVIGEILAIPFSTVWEGLSENWRGMVPLTFKFTVSSLVIPFGLMIALVFLWVRFAEGRPLQSLGFPNTLAGKTYLEGFVLGLMLFSFYVLFAFLFGVYRLDSFHFNGFSVAVWLPVLITLPGWLIQGASEEILTRGWLFQAASKKHVATGVVLSSMIFAMLHLANNGITVLSFINLVLYGLFAVFYALKTENLWAVCGFHSAWNWVQGNVYGIAVSGHDILGGSLFDPGRAQGSDLLTGGAFGAEGSIIVSVILVLGIIWTLIRQKQFSRL